MSTFRPLQVPQQPRIFFTPGQPLGIPVPFTEYQRAAYWRPREQVEAAQAAANLKPFLTPTGGGLPRALEFQTAAYWRGPPQVPQQPMIYFTPGQLLGVPLPLQTDQTQALWRARVEIPQLVKFMPIAAPAVFLPALALQVPDRVRATSVEILIEASSEYFTAGFAIGVPNPVQGDQRHALWRPVPQVPLQITYPATVGLALGVPNPQQTDQTQALWRARIEIQQPLIFAPQPAAFALIAPLALQIPDRVRATPIEILSTAATVYFTPGLSLGVPNPQQSDQRHATWRPVPQVPQQPVYFVTTGTLLGTPNPQQGDQSAAYRRPREQLEAAQVAAGIVDVPFTPGFALVQIAKPPEAQASALWRAHAEIVQPVVYAPIIAPTSNVPPNALQAVVGTRWAMEWMIAMWQVPFTLGTVLGTPQPRQGDQTPALWRARIETMQPIVYTPPAPLTTYVPPSMLQSVTSARWAMEWMIATWDVPFTQGLALGVPQPRQVDQTVAWWRGHVEIIQPATYALPSAPSASVPYVAPPTPINASWRYEWLIDFMQPEMLPQPTLAVPPVPLQVPDNRRVDLTWLIDFLQPELVPPTAPPPALALQVPETRRIGFEWYVRLNVVMPPPTAAVVPQQAFRLPPPVPVWPYAQEHVVLRRFTDIATSLAVFSDPCFTVILGARAFVVSMPFRGFSVMEPTRGFNVSLGARQFNVVLGARNFTTKGTC